MNRFWIVLGILFVDFFSAQVAFGGKLEVEGSAVVDFPEDTGKGVILPWLVKLDVVEHSAGTLGYSLEHKKVLWYNGESWEDLSLREGTVGELEEAELLESEPMNGGDVIIGEPLNVPQAVLALNAPGKALVLPRESKPWLSIREPEPGTMVYDKALRLWCVFNGLEWTFWGL
ncbi:hypothetical protein [Bergeyella sp. RCAD1439]|uniref:hypothetical protein n=1 Tax=Bergeyella anatis TaxID=3113737 RepID=UPI002E19C859|nr:hypothetical protein [Bergeyella sp. RCAD1439]